jgi:2-polyprenyl-6-methoxyphenol hydroxylase-like FAD-dependent oxidoreductase
MPQWDLLDFLAGEAAKYPTFHLHMEAEVTELVEEAGRVTGVRGTGRDGPFEVRADLVVAADGRRSIVRERAGLAVEDLGAPIDVLWMRLSRRPGDPEDTLGHLRAGHLLVMLDRGTYWQCAFVIAKGGYEALRRGGLPAFRETLRAVVPFLGDRLDELASWDDVHLLTVRVDRLRRWHRPGLLCIGDAAHAMSPVGGVGINLAIQDAVAAANLLAEPLRAGPPTDAQLAAVQRRREFPTRVTQRVQVLIQDRILSRRALGQAPTDELPVLARLLRDHPALRRVPARLIGLGIRPEHVRTPASESPSGLGA